MQAVVSTDANAWSGGMQSSGQASAIAHQPWGTCWWMFTRSLFVFAGANAALSAFRQALSGRAFTLVNHSLRPSSPFPLWAICSCYSCSPMGQVLIQIHGVVKHANHLEHLVCRNEATRCFGHRLPIQLFRRIADGSMPFSGGEEVDDERTRQQRFCFPGRLCSGHACALLPA